MKETVEFPGKNSIKRCKEILKGRTDCEWWSVNEI
jgi:hypothetical protein